MGATEILSDPSSTPSKTPHRAPNPALLFDVLQEDDASKQQQKLTRASIDLAPPGTVFRTVRRSSNGSGCASEGRRSFSLHEPAATGADGADAGTVAILEQQQQQQQEQDEGDSTRQQQQQHQHDTEQVEEHDGSAGSDSDRLPHHHSMTPAEVLQELLGPLYVDSSKLKMGDQLGQGGFAEVRRATLEDPNALPGFEEAVAVKTLRPDVLRSAQELREFLAEANLLRKMAHPNIVRLRGVGAADLKDLVSMRESMLVVQELMAGGDLKCLVAEAMTRPFDSPYTKVDALRWAMQIAEAMQYLHGVCRPMIIHRDLKLDNVLLTGGPVHSAQAKLADFGLHKRVRAILQSGIALPWAQDVCLQGDACEKSYYGGNMYMASSASSLASSSSAFLASGAGAAAPSAGPIGASGDASAGGAMRRSSSVGALASVAEHSKDRGGSKGAAATGLKVLAAAGGDIATRVLSSAGVGDARGGGSLHGGAGGAPEGSVHRRMAAVQALEGSVRAGSAFYNTAAPGSQGSLARLDSGRWPKGGAGAGAAPGQGAGNSGSGSFGELEAAEGAGPSAPPPGKARVSFREGASTEGSQRCVPLDATQKVGSLLYMAPEVIRGGHYSEKVDVFSYGIMLYELFSGCLLASRVTMGMPDGTLAGEGRLAEYAEQVAAGHREEMPAYWPQPIKKLIADCWAQDPSKRPSFARILDQLYQMKRGHVAETLDALRPRGNYNPTSDCGCSIM